MVRRSGGVRAEGEIITGCPECLSVRVIRNGVRNGRQYMRCKECGHQYYASPVRRRLHPDVVRMIGQLIDDGVRSVIIARAAGVSERTISYYRNKKLKCTTTNR